MAYGFNDNKSKKTIKDLNGIGDIPLTGSGEKKTISAGQTRRFLFQSSWIFPENVVGVLGIVLKDTSGNIPRVTIGEFDFKETGTYAAYEVTLTNPTNQTVYLSNNSKIRVRIPT